MTKVQRSADVERSKSYIQKMSNNVPVSVDSDAISLDSERFANTSVWYQHHSEDTNEELTSIYRNLTIFVEYRARSIDDDVDERNT